MAKVFCMCYEDFGSVMRYEMLVIEHVWKRCMCEWKIWKTWIGLGVGTSTVQSPVARGHDM